MKREIAHFFMEKLDSNKLKYTEYDCWIWPKKKIYVNLTNHVGKFQIKLTWPEIHMKISGEIHVNAVRFIMTLKH